jgi:DNA polymerase
MGQSVKETVSAKQAELTSLDMEFYYDSDHSVTELSPEKYAEDPKSECYLAAIIKDGMLEFAGPPEDVPWEELHGTDIAAHNAAFDRAGFEALQRKGIIPNWIRPKSWLDTAALARFLGAPRGLQGASVALLGREIDKGYRGVAKGRRAKDFTEDEWWDIFDSCVADAKAAYEIAKRFQDEWPTWERCLADLHMTHSRRGILVEQGKLTKGRIKLRAIKTDLEAQIPWTLIGGKPTSRKHLIAYCESHELPVPKSFSKSNTDYSNWEKAHETQHPAIRAVRDWREVNGILKRLQRIERRIRRDGRISVELKYFGAATGRSSGGVLNLHSLPNGERFGVNIRGMFIPEKGHVFLSADLCQIEPRVIATLMREEQILTQIREGENIYAAYARSYLGWVGVDLKRENPSLYALSKICVLSLGYGTGPLRFQEACAEAGVEITAPKAKDAVMQFRSSYPLLLRQWGELESSFKRHAGQAAPFEIPLPTGRILRYYDCAYRPTDGAYVARPVRGKSHQKYWGSKLFENAIQATARDVFMQQLLKMEANGLRTVLHIHDEVLIEVPIDEVESAKAKVQQIMTTPPDWLPGLPLACEVKVLNCFE